MSERKQAKKNSRSPAAAAAPGGNSPMDVSLLERMVKLMAVNDLNTVDVRDGDKRIILKRGTQQVFTTVHGPGHAASAANPAPAADPAAADPAAQPQEEANLIPVKSPMVGTFYAAPSKGAKPFVTLGSRVEEETDVCIVEAMKVFNNIKAECRGTIERILATDSQPVEFGQILFLVKPS